MKIKKLKIIRKQCFDFKFFSNKTKNLIFIKKFNLSNSDFKIQLKEKNNLKILYNLSEFFIKKLCLNIKKKKYCNINYILIELIERRIDNLLFISGIFPTRAASAQFILYGGTIINNKRINIKSYIFNYSDSLFFINKSYNFNNKKFKYFKWDINNKVYHLNTFLFKKNLVNRINFAVILSMYSCI